jgi:hypothetical protein
MVFVRLSQSHENGWGRQTERLLDAYHVINGFTMTVRAAMETVIENAFDRLHFRTVHGVRTDAFVVKAGELGELTVESVFHLPTPSSMGQVGAASVSAAYRAVVISPGLALVELRGASPYAVITGATALPEGGCAIRLSLALPRSRFVGEPPPSAYEGLLEHSRKGLEEDRAIWERLSPSAPPTWTIDDHASLEFLRFCEGFRDDRE